MFRLGLALGLVGLAAAPASAQFFLKSHDFSGQPVHGDESGIGVEMPGATAAELRAALTWNMRAALNVAALQCQFEPTLPTVRNYNAMLTDHKDELADVFATLGKYFSRTAKTKALGQQGLDQFGTRTYAGFSTVAAQYGFCQTASSIGREAAFKPRGHLGDVAQERMRELRNSLIPYGEQLFPRYIGHDTAALPRFDAICWNKKGEWNDRKCGQQNWPPTGTGIAAN